jgi:hypothetical protein
MPVVAAILFEFCLRGLRLRTLANRADRKLSTLRWIYPAERLRVQLHMATDEHMSAEAATRHVRVHRAARRLYQLRAALSAHDQSAVVGRRVRWSERRAYGALARAGFADPAIATAVLRQVQVLTSTVALARLDYRTPDAAQAAIDNLIGSPTAAKPEPEPEHQEDSQPEEPADNGDRDAQLVTAAARIVAAPNRDGGRLSQAALALLFAGARPRGRFPEPAQPVEAYFDRFPVQHEVAAVDALPHADEAQLGHAYRRLHAQPGQVLVGHEPRHGRRQPNGLWRRTAAHTPRTGGRRVELNG